jgi:predicted transcriptional regulator
MKPTTAQTAFIKEVVEFCYGFGLPTSFSRVMGWLLLCEPEEQSAEDIQRALGLSVGTVNSAVNMLGRSGLVERRIRPGGRRYFYRLNPDSWKDVLEKRVASLGTARTLAERGLALSPGNRRLVGMRDFYAWVEREFTKVLRQSGGPPSPPTS